MTGWTVGVGGEKSGGEVRVRVKSSLMRGSRGRRAMGWRGVVGVGERSVAERGERRRGRVRRMFMVVVYGGNVVQRVRGVGDTMGEVYLYWAWWAKLYPVVLIEGSLWGSLNCRSVDFEVVLLTGVGFPCVTIETR